MESVYHGASGFRCGPPTGYTEEVPGTFEQLFEPLCRVYDQSGLADKTPPAMFAKLIKFKLVELNVTGVPQLTGFGQNDFTAIESTACRYGE